MVFSKKSGFSRLILNYLNKILEKILDPITFDASSQQSTDT